MARDAGNFDAIIWVGYYVPLQESHPTAQAIVHRVKFTTSGRWEYVEEPKPDMDRNTFVVAHFLILRAIDAMSDHFNLDLDLQGLFDTYVRIIKQAAKKNKSVKV